MNAARYVVGIDPGKITGVAVYDRHEKKIARVISSTFWGCHDFLYASNPGDYYVRIEVANTKASFGGNNSHTKSVNIGMIHGVSHALYDGINRLGFDVEKVHPTGIGKRMNHYSISKLTGWNEQTNEHTRDAIMLCWEQ